jgi:1,4-dihydroxy-2-naphthoate octaprenyltransferase
LTGLLFWMKASRAPFFTGSLAPCAVGTAAAFLRLGGVDWPVAILTLLALVCLHASANMANDYYDHLSGADEINVSYATPFTGGSRVIQNDAARPRLILSASLMALTLGAAIGAYLVWRTGWPILVLGVIGGATGFFYTAPPLKLGYRGLGEIFIFLDFGVLPVLGAQYVQTLGFDAVGLVAAVPVGLLMMNVLWINQFQDVDADGAVGKRHWVVRLGRRTAAKVHALVFLLSYAVIAAGIVGGILPGPTALALLSLPIALRAAAVALRHYDDPKRLIPANVGTIATHLTTSLLIALGLAIAGVL